MSGNNINKVVAIEKEFLGLRSLEGCAYEAKYMYISSAFSIVFSHFFTCHV